MSPAIGQLLIRQPDNSIRIFPLSEEKITVGRNPENALQLDHPLISRHHADLHLDPQGLIITDLGSANGTFVGGDRLLRDQPRLLEPGLEVHIGPYVLLYETHDLGPEAEGGVTETAALAKVPFTVELVPLEVALPSAPLISQADLIVAPTPPRASFPSQVAEGTASRYIQELPASYRDNEFLGRFLLIFETIWEQLEQRQDHIEMYFDPLTCPATFLPWLANWLDIQMSEQLPEERIRRLLAEGVELYHWRGTRYGLARMIEVCTGLFPEIKEDPSKPFVIHVSISTNEHDIDKTLVEDLIQAHKPAHLSYALEIVSK